LGENLTNEKVIHKKELEDNEIILSKESNENSHNNVQTSNVTILDNEYQNNLEENENITNLPNNILNFPKDENKNLISNFISQKARNIYFK
jgi:hypothetical protein